MNNIKVMLCKSLAKYLESCKHLRLFSNSKSFEETEFIKILSYHAK